MALIGQPVQVINVDLNKRLFVDKEIVKRILVKDEIKDLPVVVVSIVGTYRQGKSFILNFFLRFLNHTCKGKKNANDWLDTQDGTLSGFAWKNSTRRETVGIMVWSEIFISNLPSGEEVGIILLDTQGTFDNQSSANEYGNIFSLASLLSSVQIYNLKDNIKLNDLMYLEFFLKYGQLLSDNNPEVTPFQKILFLIRDWANPREYPFGNEGGLSYLKHQFDMMENASEKKRQLKTCLTTCFKDLDGFLLPEPGSKVTLYATKNLDEIDEKFRNFAKLLVSKILNRSRLIVKEINGRRVTVTEFFDLMAKYCELLNDQSIDPDVIYKATAEVQNWSSIQHCLKKYESLMSITINSNFQSVSDESLNATHFRNKTLAIEEFKGMKKMGDDEMLKKSEASLVEIVEQKFEDYKSLNIAQRNLENQKKEELAQKQKQAEESKELKQGLIKLLEEQLADWEENFKCKEKSKEEAKARKNMF